MRRFIQGLMLIAIAVGLVQYMRLQATDSELIEEHRRLSIKHGILPVDDPTKFSLRRIQLDEPAHFAWRCYVPPDQELVMNQQYLGGSGNHSARHSPEHGILRLRIGKRESGIQIYCSGASGAMSGSFAYPESLAQFLLDHWDELDIQVAPDDLLDRDFDEAVTLVSVSVPDALKKKAIAEIPDSKSHQIESRLSKPVLELHCGTQQAINQQKK